MTALGRRAAALIGGGLLGTSVGSAFDRAGVTAHHDSDIGSYGLVAGLGLGLLMSALIHENRSDRMPERRGDRPSS